MRWPERSEGKPSGDPQKLFLHFASSLKDSGIRHCFLRGFSAFPSLEKNADVDILVHPADLSRVEIVFRTSAKYAGFNIWQRMRSGFLTRFFAYGFAGEKKHHFFDLDIHTSEASYGVPYLQAEALLAFAESDGPIFRLPEHLSALVSSLGHFFAGGKIPTKYREIWEKGASDPVCLDFLQKIVGLKSAALLVRSLKEAQAGLHSPVLSQGKKFGASARWRAFLRRPVLSLIGLLAFAYGETLRPLFLPRGRFLVFLGTDGSGKSSLIEELSSQISKRFRDGAVEKKHLRPGLLPQISALFHGGKPAYSLADMSNPHRAQASGFVGSAARLTYYWLDYFLGFCISIAPKRRRNSLIIYDRWFFDYLVDPRRYRVMPKHPLIPLLSRCLPRPDLVFICWAPEEIIRQRKQELPQEEMERQLESYKKLVTTLPKAVLIDTSESKNRCIDKIIRQTFSENR